MVTNQKASQSDNRKQASLVKFRMWSVNNIERTKEVLSKELPMMCTVKRIRKETVSPFSFFVKKKSSIYATFQKLKTQFLSVMSTVRNVNLTTLLKGSVSQCTRYILIYIFS